MTIQRATFIAKMRKAFREGKKGTPFYWELRALGPVYQKSQFLADWRSIAGLERKEGAARFVRKDYYPTKAVIAQVEWSLSKEFMYKVKVESRTRPDEPLDERFVNIMSDRPLTPREYEELAWEMIKEQSPKRIGEVEQISGWSAVQRIA